MPFEARKSEITFVFSAMTLERVMRRLEAISVKEVFNGKWAYGLDHLAVSNLFRTRPGILIQKICIPVVNWKSHHGILFGLHVEFRPHRTG